MKNIKTLVRLLKYKRSRELNNPINRLYDCIDQLAAIYGYRQSEHYKQSQRDIINLRMAEIKFNIEQYLRDLL